MINVVTEYPLRFVLILLLSIELLPIFFQCSPRDGVLFLYFVSRSSSGNSMMVSKAFNSELNFTDLQPGIHSSVWSVLAKSASASACVENVSKVVMNHSQVVSS